MSTGSTKLNVEYILMPIYDEKCREVKALESTVAKLTSALTIAADQLAGVSLAFKANGLNLNPDFFITTYERMSLSARAALAEIKGKA